MVVGKLSSDSGEIFFREKANRTGFFPRVKDCFIDNPTSCLLEHPLIDLLKQRIYLVNASYHDLNEHDALKRNPKSQLRQGSAGGCIY
jgi:hypothetical protein